MDSSAGEFVMITSATHLLKTEQEKGSLQKHRKRKIDSDGFVRPFTPDIPSSDSPSSMNMPEGLETTDLFCSESESPSEQPESETVSSYFQATGETQVLTQIYQGEEDYQIRGEYQDNYQTGEDNPPNEEGAATQDGTSSIMQSFFKNFQEESAMMINQWSQVFRQSEDFEKVCPQKLDDLISEARAIEDSLNNKKEAICSRLKSIGKTLEV